MSDLPADVLKHVVDVHCHPTDSEMTAQDIKELTIKICAMATRPSDQELVASLARANPQHVIPCFGFHPWFAHWISVDDGVASKEDHYRRLFSPQLDGSDQLEKENLFEKALLHLPDPVPLASCLDSIRGHFEEFPAAMLGEVGLDKSARIPIDPRAEERRLSPFLLPFEHQLVVLEAQLNVAVEMKRNISLHSVKSQKATLDLLEGMQEQHGDDWSRVSIDFHSCGLSSETWKSIEKTYPNAFLSLSTEINSRSPNHRKLIKVVSDSRILVESDIHEIGQVSDRTLDMLRTVAEIKGWQVESHWEEDLEESQWGAVRRLERNFENFRQGGHFALSKRKE